MIGAKLIEAAGNGISTGGAVAEAIDFDGTNDYLYRATNLTGSSNVKTFTFSAFVYLQNTGATQYIFDDSKYYIYVQSSGSLNIRGTGSSLVLNANTASGSFPFNTFVNIVVSIDLANTSNRYVYFNDVQQSVTWTTYTNSAIWFDSGTSCAVGASYDGAFNRLKGRLSNVYLDYTYRDLSVEANRRLFVTADLKPAADQAALNPILYLPMDDPTAPGANAGTGGDFTLTGTVARSGRGPNQYNAPYSDLDGSADYLERTSIAGAADGKQFTLAFSFNADSASSPNIMFFSSTTSVRFRVEFVDSLTINIQAYNASGVGICQIYGTTPAALGRNYSIVASVDLTDTNKCHLYINGVSNLYKATFVNDNIDFTVNRYRVGTSAAGTPYFNGRLGALWFNTSYIDLSNADNLAKFVTGTGIDAKPVDLGANGELPTGTSPLIYLPMYGNNAGKNYGTGGNFTVNSGPYTGARGPNEFWGNKAIFNGSSSNITRSTMSGVSASKTVSGCFWIRVANFPASQAGVLYGAYGLRIRVTSTTSQPLTFSATNSSSSIILSVQTNTTTFSTTPYYCVQYCFDMADSAKSFVYINGVSQSLIVSTYKNANIAHNLMAPIIGWNNGSGYLNGGLAEMYMTTEYIDFSLESNRLKFCDAFGNPVDLSAQITAAAIPTPAIYMRFPPTSFGTNTGTGGDFTPTSITDGGQL